MDDTARPFGDLSDTGLLWLINRVVFHPRGYALAIHEDGAGNVTGWSLLGDGSEPWRFDASDSFDEDELYRKAQALLAPRNQSRARVVAFGGFGDGRWHAVRLPDTARTLCGRTVEGPFAWSGPWEQAVADAAEQCCAPCAARAPLGP